MKHKYIGGFFDLELNDNETLYHDNALALNSGRACLLLILNNIKPRKIYIPYYTCDIIIKTLRFAKVSYKYYVINKKLEPDRVDLKEEEYILYINYFGIKSDIINNLIKKYEHNIIIDNSQGFYEKAYDNIWSFNSARKFFGVPDGAFLYSPIDIDLNQYIIPNMVFYEHLINRLIGKQGKAYKQFRLSENKIDFKIKNISDLSLKILRGVDYKKVKQKRLKNFNYLNKKLKEFNRLKFQKKKKDVPMCYPFFPKKMIDKKYFHSKNIFIPSFWERKIATIKFGFDYEKKMLKYLLPLPIDQRYDYDDLDYILAKVLNKVN